MLRIAVAVGLLAACFCSEAMAQRYGNFELQPVGEGGLEARAVAVEGGSLRFGCEAGGPLTVIAAAEKNLYAGKTPTRPVEITLDVDDRRFGPFAAQHNGHEARLEGADAAALLQALQIRGRVRLLLRASQGYERPIRLRLEGVEDAILQVQASCPPL